MHIYTHLQSSHYILISFDPSFAQESPSRNTHLRDALVCSGAQWRAWGRSATLWDALGRVGTLWDALVRSRTLWDAFPLPITPAPPPKKRVV